ncbi:MAG: hypothetical protein B7733_22165 [Myxococcales bacterium FL481]|nr:MAG: hypothetical protein B7733_22165 [Myxococcales bacterium FL481]
MRRHKSLRPVDCLFPGLCLALGLWSWACSGDGSNDDDDASEESDAVAPGDQMNPGENMDPGTTPDHPQAEPFSHRGMLVSLVNHVLQPAHQSFVTACQELVATTEHAANATAQATPDAPAALEAARQAWRTAAAAWQRIEMMQIGPAASSISDSGGADLRDEVYSWPTVNTCRVDQEIVTRSYLEPDFAQSQLVNVYGLDAAEYLLFHDDPGNTCPPQIPINDGTWAALGDAEIAARRAAYAASVSRDLLARAQQLHAAWDPAGGGFAAAFIDPGQGASPYQNVGEVFNGVFRAMFYLDLVTKDQKLARPTGLDGTCPTASCPERVESRWAHASREHLLANLAAFEALYYGADTPAAGIGFDDFLVHVGAPAIATDLTVAIDAAQARMQNGAGTLAEAVAQDNETVKADHAAVKAITDILKGPFHVALNLTIPEEGAGDSD